MGKPQTALSPYEKKKRDLPQTSRLYPMRSNKETSHKQTTFSPVGRAGEGHKKEITKPKN